MGEEDRAPGGSPEVGIGEAEQVSGIEPGDSCQLTGTCLASVLLEGRPETIAAGVEVRQFYIRSGSATDRAEGPVGIEAEREFAIAAEFSAGQFAAFEEIEDYQVKQRLVRRRAAGPVPFERDQFVDPVLTRPLPDRKLSNGHAHTSSSESVQVFAAREGAGRLQRVTADRHDVAAAACGAAFASWKTCDARCRKCLARCRSNFCIAHDRSGAMQDVFCIVQGTCCMMSEQVLHRAGHVRGDVKEIFHGMAA